MTPMRAVGQLKVKFGSNPWRSHGVIAGAAGVIDRQHDFRHGGAGHALDHFGARPDDARRFRLDADHEAGDILHIEQRQAMALGVLDEISDFAGGFRIDDAADARAGLRFQKAAAIRDDADVSSVQARRCAQKFRRILGLKFEEIVRIENSLEQIFHTIGQTVIGGKHIVQTIGFEPRRSARRSVECAAAFGGTAAESFRGKPHHLRRGNARRR